MNRVDQEAGAQACSDDQVAELGAAAAPDDDVLTIAEAARLLKVAPNTLYLACGKGKVPHRRIGRSIRLSRAGLMRWLERWSLDPQEGT